MKNILLGEGLDTLKFGMTREEVTTLLGEPTEIESDSEDNIAFDTYHYDDNELSLIFDSSAEFKLVSIASSADEVLLKERKVIGLSEGDLLTTLDSMDFEDITDDYFEGGDEGENMYTSDEFGVNFFIDDNKVTEIIWYPEFTEEGEVVWP